jgi:hypothetical protein
MGAGVLSRTLREGAAFDEVMRSSADLQTNRLPRPPVTLSVTQDPATLQSEVEASAGRHDHCRTYALDGAPYLLLSYWDGMISAVGVPREPLDVLSGVFTGCWMGVYLNRRGEGYVCHVSTTGGLGDCKTRWRLMTKGNPEVVAAYRFAPGVVTAAIGREIAEGRGPAGTRTPYLGYQAWGVVPTDDILHPFVVVTAKTPDGDWIVYRRVDLAAEPFAGGDDAERVFWWVGDDDY